MTQPTVLTIFIAFLMLVSCNNNNLPKDVLPPEKMQEVMWDYLRADAFTTDFIQKDSTKNAAFENVQLQKKIFEKYKTTKEIFYKSLKYYEANPAIMKVMMDSMITQKRRISDSLKIDLNIAKGRKLVVDTTAIADTAIPKAVNKIEEKDTTVLKGKKLKKLNKRIVATPL